MLNDVTFYHETIRNTIVAFGHLFSNVKLARKKGNVIEQTIKVPIAYAQKDKWVQATEANPDSERGIQVSFPRMGFEITGYSYDATRKLPRMNMVSCTTDDGRKQAFTPVPYNIDISLYVGTKSQEDALQIIEQILPTFTPEYHVSIRSVTDLNIIQDVPFILNNISVDDSYDGNVADRRMVIHTLSFTAKVNLYGPVSDVGVIKRVDVGVTTPNSTYTAIGTIPSEPIVEMWLEDF